MRQELARLADRLQRELGGLPGGSQRYLAVDASRRIVRGAYADLGRVLEDAVAGSRAAAFKEIYEIWSQATFQTAQLQGIPLALVGAVTIPPITLVGAYEALGGAAATWRTLIRGHVATAAMDADTLVSRALLEGMDPGKLSRALRPYVQGAEPFYQAAVRAGLDPSFDFRRLQDPSLREAARRLGYNADRIAFSETHNARAEAELQHFALDPLVEAILWELSPNRGKAPIPCICDALASNDWYGLGKGVYPLHSVPHPPHPFDRCERSPVVRDYSRINEPKPNPDLVLAMSGADLGGQMTEEGARRRRDQLAGLFAASHRSLKVGSQVQELIAFSQSRVAGGVLL
jgi:hypothetical protein